MSFWKRSKQSSAGDAGQVQKRKKGVKRASPVAMEIKILALEALDSGLSADESVAWDEDAAWVFDQTPPDDGIA